MANGNITAIQQEINTGITGLNAVKTGKMVTLHTIGNAVPCPTSGTQLPTSLCPVGNVSVPCTAFYGGQWHVLWASIKTDSKIYCYNASNLQAADYLGFSVTYELANP